MQADVVVVGAGLAGLVAAAAAVRRGRRVVVVAAGQGTLPAFGGPIAVLGVAGSPLAALRGWVRDLPHHPYAIFGPERLAAALAFFLDLAAEAGCPYRGLPDGPNVPVPTLLGGRYPAPLLPRSMADAGAPAVVCDVRGVGDGLGPQVSRAWSPPARVVWLPRPSLHPRADGLGLARYLDRPDGREWMIDAGRRLLAGGEAPVVLPPLLGLEGHAGLCADLAAALGVPVAEWMGWPPSLPGLRLRDALVRWLEGRGVGFLWGSSVRAEGGALLAGSPPRPLRADSYVLATGGLAGGGLVREPAGAYRDSVLGVTLESGAVPGGELFGENAAFRCGLRVDGDARVLGVPAGLLEGDVFAAGRGLAGYDPDLEASGGGVAVLSGWVAGRCA